MLKLKLQYFEQRANSLDKTLILGKIEGRKRWVRRKRWLDGIANQWIWVCTSSRRWWRIGKPGMLQSLGLQSAGHTEWLNSKNNIISSYAFLSFLRGIGICAWVHSKSLQGCSTLCDPMNCSSPGSSVHGGSPGKNTGVGCHALLQGIFRPRDQILFSYVSCIGRWVLYH